MRKSTEQTSANQVKPKKKEVETKRDATCSPAHIRIFTGQKERWKCTRGLENVSALMQRIVTVGCEGRLPPQHGDTVVDTQAQAHAHTGVKSKLPLNGNRKSLTYQVEQAVGPRHAHHERTCQARGLRVTFWAVQVSGDDIRLVQICRCADAEGLQYELMGL